MECVATGIHERLCSLCVQDKNKMRIHCVIFKYGTYNYSNCAAVPSVPRCMKCALKTGNSFVMFLVI